MLTCIGLATRTQLTFSALAMLANLAGCRSVMPPARLDLTLPERVPGLAAPPRAEVSILSAHAAFANAETLGGRDGISVVFSEEVDPASLDPRFFLVLFSDGSRVRPDEAVLAPASEADENRTLMLVGDFGEFGTATVSAGSEAAADAPVQEAPADVLVIGPLYAERGTKLRGLLAPVSPFTSPGIPVLAISQPSNAGSCPAQELAVRTYWVDALRGVEEADLAKIRLEFADGETASPAGFDDHQSPGDDREDNVLDLCVAGAQKVVRSVAFEAGAFTDAAGHASGSAQLAVVAAATGAIPGASVVR